MITARTYGLVGPIGAHEPRGSLTSWRRRLLDESARQRRQCWQCLGVGVAIQLLVPPGMGLLLMAFNLWAVASAAGNPTATFRPVKLSAVAVMSVICWVTTLLVAVATKPSGRAERAEEFLHNSLESNTSEGGGLGGVGLVLLMLTSLYGSFAIVEAIKRFWVRRKLRHVNVFDAARVLAEVAANPTGAQADRLLRRGQEPLCLRESVALLLLDGWIDLRDGGKSLVMRSPAMRRLTCPHPLAEIFTSVSH